jgi:hypothetical protein
MNRILCYGPGVFAKRVSIPARPFGRLSAVLVMAIPGRSEGIIL